MLKIFEQNLKFDAVCFTGKKSNCKLISFTLIKLLIATAQQNCLSKIKNNSYVIAMCIEGKQVSSEELANEIKSISMTNSNITFIIGGSYGLHEDIKKRSNYALSFSKMTFPHQMFRIMLLEQIYRSYKILNNESYHK